MHRSALALTALLLIQLAHGQSDAALSSLDGLLQGIDTMAADVLQLILESDGGVLEESEIKMYLKKPNGFYWETTEPFPELIVTDGTRLWNYQPDLEQVVIEDWDSSRSELAAQLLNGQTENLAEEYHIELLGEGTEIEEFQLTPIASDSVYSKISISFARGELEMIHMASKNGEQTVWSFINIERNQPLEDSLFVFEAPAGIEVIQNTYTQ